MIWVRGKATGHMIISISSDEDDDNEVMNKDSVLRTATMMIMSGKLLISDQY